MSVGHLAPPLTGTVAERVAGESGRESTLPSGHLRSGTVLAAASHHSRCLELLMVRRPDLRGVSAMADLLHESVRWSA